MLSNVYPACISRMYLPYLECISVNISYLSRMISQYRARHSYKKFTKLYSVYTREKNDTTVSHGETVGPPPLKGMVTTFTSTTAKNKLPPNPDTSIPSKCRCPPPVGKAGFEVWVFTKGGLVCTNKCRSVRIVGSHHPIVHAHLLGRYAQTSGARVYRYGPVNQATLS